MELTVEQEWAIGLAAEASYKLHQHNQNKPTGDNIAHKRWMLTKQQLLLALKEGVNGIFLNTSRGVDLRIQLPGSYKSLSYFYNGMFKDYNDVNMEHFFGLKAEELVSSAEENIANSQLQLEKVMDELEKLVQQFKPIIVAMELL